MDMIERVARAIHAKAFETRDFQLAPDWDAVARAAMEAMREPTEEMIHAGGNTGYFDDMCISDAEVAAARRDCIDVWKAMLNAGIQTKAL